MKYNKLCDRIFFSIIIVEVRSEKWRCWARKSFERLWDRHCPMICSLNLMADYTFLHSKVCRKSLCDLTFMVTCLLSICLSPFTKRINPVSQPHLDNSGCIHIKIFHSVIPSRIPVLQISPYFLGGGEAMIQHSKMTVFYYVLYYTGFIFILQSCIYKAL